MTCPETPTVVRYVRLKVAESGNMTCFIVELNIILGQIYYRLGKTEPVLEN